MTEFFLHNRTFRFPRPEEGASRNACQRRQHEPPARGVAADNGDNPIERTTDEENGAGCVRDFSIRFSQSERKLILESIFARHAGADSNAQCLRLLQAVRQLGGVTTFEASRFLDVYNPPARKRDLVRQGFVIFTRWKLVRTEGGCVHRVGEYHLVTCPDNKVAAPVQQEFSF